MAYSKSIRKDPRYYPNAKYPARIGKRESRVYQFAVDTVLNDAADVSSDYSPSDAIKVILTNGALTVTMPASSVSQGRRIAVAVKTAGAVTLVASGADSIVDPGLASVNDYAEFLCVGDTWVAL